jgi:hypothetical protein
MVQGLRIAEFSQDCAFLCAETNTPSENKHEQPVYSDEDISNMVDVLMRDSDLNNDGFIDYAEFKQTEKK